MRLVRAIVVCVLAMIVNQSFSQDIKTETSEIPLHEIQVAGFSTSVHSDIKPQIVESSNGSVYAMLYRRKNVDWSVFADDTSIPFLQLRQLVLQIPEDSESTVAEMQTSLVADAKRSAQQAGFADEAVETSDCVRVIGGVQRSGVSFLITLPNENDANEAGYKGIIECYAFANLGNRGVGVIVKRRINEDEQSVIDENLSDELLDNLVVEQMDIYTPYIAMIAEYPVSLPVGSSISDLQKVSEYAITGTINLYNATAVLQLGMVPSSYSVYTTASELETAHHADVELQVGQGNIDVEWKSTSYIPVGQDSKGIAESNVYMLSLKDGRQIYNVRHSIIDEPYIMTITMNAAPEFAEMAHKYSEAFYAKTQADMSPTSSSLNTFHAPGYEIKAPSGYYSRTLHHNDKLDSMTISLASALNAENILDSGLEHKPYTQIKLYPSVRSMSIQSSHRAVCQQVREQHRDLIKFKEAEIFGDDGSEIRIKMQNGLEVVALTNTFLPKDNDQNAISLALNHEEMSVTSFMIPVDDEHTIAVISCVSNSLMHPDAMSVTKQIAEWIEPTTEHSRIFKSFGSIEYDKWIGDAYTFDSTYDDTVNTKMTFGSDSVLFITEESNERFTVLSKRSLAESFIHSQWKQNVFRIEESLYPEDSEGLTEIEIAGFSGLMFEARLMPQEEWEEGSRSNPLYIRIVGFQHGNQYTTIVMRQETEFESSRFDKYLKMILPIE